MFTFPTPKENEFTIASYNIENLFDIYDNPNTLDDDFTPNGKKKWTKQRYTQKIQQLGRVIRKIGFTDKQQAPLLVGLTEVENKQVLDDLIKCPSLEDCGYDYIHFDSSDERGIDVALLYKKEWVSIDRATTVPIHITTPKGSIDYTRDILQVHLRFKETEFVVFVNHWPSRRDKTKFNIQKRILAAQACRQAIDTLLEKNPQEQFIVLGDFNDDAVDTSVKDYLVKSDLCESRAKLKT